MITRHVYTATRRHHAAANRHHNKQSAGGKAKREEASGHTPSNGQPPTGQRPADASKHPRQHNSNAQDRGEGKRIGKANAARGPTRGKRSKTETKPGKKN